MPKLIITIFFLMSTSTAMWASSESNSFEAILSRAARTQGIPERLLLAICLTESGEGTGRLNPQAFSPDDGAPGNHSFGACQVLLSTAKGMGFLDRDEKCQNYRTRRKAEYTACGLFGPTTNAHFAATYLRKQLTRYHGNWTAAIASYNAGSARMCPPRRNLKNWKGDVVTKCRLGEYANQGYVDRVLMQLDKLDKLLHM